MDWSNERYVRWYTRETVADAALTWEAKAIWALVIKRLDRAGVLPLEGYGARGLAGLIRMPVDVVEAHLPHLLDDGRIELRGDFLVAPNFLDAQEANQSDRQRQAESRARRRDLARAEQLQGVLPIVTNCDQSSQYATKCHEQSHGVTNGHSEPSQTNPSLAEPSRAKRVSRGKADAVRALAQGAIDHFNLKLGTRRTVTSSVLTDIGKLAKTYDLAAITAVIDAKVAEWHGSPEMEKNLRPSTLFRLSNFSHYRDDLEGGPLAPGPRKTTSKTGGLTVEQILEWEEGDDDEL